MKKQTLNLTQSIFNDTEIKYAKEHEAFLSQADYFDKLDWEYELEECRIIETGEIKYLKHYKNTLKSLKHTQDNLEAIFKYNNQLNKFKYNEFTYTKEFNENNYDEDTTPADIRCWFRRTFEWCPKEDIKDTIQYILNRNKYNPIKNYIESIEWDGINRLDNFMQTYYKADDTELIRTYFKKWMVALVKRVYEPGCKFDNMLLIQGEQGKCKSTLFSWLGNINGKSYYNVAPGNVKDTQQLVYATKDKLIINFDDFDDICDKGNIGAIKEFITIQVDKTALKFEHAKEFPRHYVLCGTTNSHTFLSDDNTKDERRFWIIPIHSENSEFNIPDEIREQLYAEAYHIYKNEPEFKLWINETTLKEQEIEHQKQFKNASADPIADKIIYIFSRQYTLENGKFKNEADFLKQIETDNTMFDDTLFANENKIKFIPTRWINEYLGKDKRSGQRIIQILHTNGFKVCDKEVNKKLKGVQYRGIEIL